MSSSLLLLLSVVNSCQKNNYIRYNLARAVLSLEADEVENVMEVFPAPLSFKLNIQYIASVFILFLKSEPLQLCAHRPEPSETQRHATLSPSCLGLQVTSCLPVFLSSGTAGAINQLPLSPVVSVCPALTTTTTTTTTSDCLIWSVVSSGGHVSTPTNKDVVVSLLYLETHFRFSGSASQIRPDGLFF